MKKYVNEIYNGRYILYTLVKRDVFSKYRKSLLGVAWTLITPLSMVAIIGFVYSIIFGVSMIEFIPFLFSGLIPWLFVTASFETGAMSFVAAEGYITQTRASIYIFPLRSVLVAFVNYFFMSIAFFFVYAVLKPDAFGLQMLMCIPATFILFIFNLGVANIGSVANIYFRDYFYIQSILLQILFYITPIIYPIEIMRARGMASVYLYNPFYYFVQILRESFLGESDIHWNIWLISACVAFTVFGLSVALLRRVGRKIVFKF